MEKDAVSAGVSEVGGLFNTAEIKILVCYIFSSINFAIPGRMLADTLHYEGIANCFEVNDAIDALCKSGHLKSADSSDDTYSVTDAGRQIADTLKTSLPIAVKERAYRAALKMVSRFRNAKESITEISHEDGKTYITCSATDHGKPFISVKLLVADEEQALYIKDRFLNNSNIYSEIIELLTKPEK